MESPRYNERICSYEDSLTRPLTTIPLYWIADDVMSLTISSKPVHRFNRFTKDKLNDTILLNNYTMKIPQKWVGSYENFVKTHLVQH